MEAVLKLRAARSEKGNPSSVLEDASALGLVEEALAEGDRPALSQAVAQHKAGKVSTSASSTGDNHGEDIGQPAAATPSARATPFVPKGPTLPEPGSDDNPTVEWARTLIPVHPGCRVKRDDLWHGRWQIEYPTNKSPHSCNRSWGSEKSAKQCLKECLAWACAEHFKKNGANNFLILSLFRQ